MPLDSTLPPRFPRIPHVKKWIFSGTVFYADSKYMLDVANRHIKKKSPKNTFFDKIPKKRKNPTQNKFFIYFYLTNKVFLGFETR
jgi:hypothetical protein